MPQDKPKPQDQAGETQEGRRPTKGLPGAPSVTGALESNGRWSARGRKGPAVSAPRFKYGGAGSPDHTFLGGVTVSNLTSKQTDRRGLER